MRVLIACEFSGVLRDAFLSRGHDAYSCDILEPQTIRLLTNRPIHPNHIVSDVLDHMASLPPYYYDLIVAHPPCTYLSSSQQHLLNKSPARRLLSDKATVFALELFNLPTHRLLLENPPGLLSKNPFLPKPQNVPLTAFGDPHARRLALFRRNLPPLHWTHAPSASTARTRRLSDDPHTAYRPLLRSITTPGLAAAIADQYGALPL